MSNIIDTIQVSGVTYTIAGSGSGNSVVEVTQAQYDALVSGGTVDPTILYIITDAQAGDLTQYWTSAQTQSAITEATSGKVDTSDFNTYSASVETALSGKASQSDLETVSGQVANKQDTLVSGTNIKTINNQSLLGSGNITIQGGGGSITIDPTLDSGSTNAVANSAITKGFDDYTINTDSLNGEVRYFYWATPKNPYGSSKVIRNFSINGRCPLTRTNGSNSDIDKFNLVETSAVTSSITSSSTDAQVPSAKAVYESVSGKVDTSAMSGYVTTDTRQEITGNKTFIGSFSTNEKPIIFKQKNDSHKIGFVCRNSASTNNELATFEFRPNTFTIDNVQHPLLYFGHYRNTNTANAGVPQTVIGFRQYDQLNDAAYHYLIPLPEKAKTPFSLTTSFKDYYAPMGFKNGSTMITADNTGVVDFSDVLGGLKLVKLTQTEYDNLSTKDSNTLYVIVN